MPTSPLRRGAEWVLVLLCGAVLALAARGEQTEEDAYTRYELLDPQAGAFLIRYDVTATSAGAVRYWNGIRRGALPVLHEVIDRSSGARLRAAVVDAAAARAHGYAGAEDGARYIEVELPRPVPAGGGVRLHIAKTYRDPESHRATAGGLLFERSLGVRNNAVVLPAGYEVTECNVPSQVATEADGRVRISFLERGAGPTPLRLAGRRAGAATPRPAAGGGTIEARPPEQVLRPSSARTGADWPERAREEREIVYLLEAPETHSFRLYHDTTEDRPGIDRYLNVVRPGSRVAAPSARNLDTGEELRVETLRGAAAVAARGKEVGDEIGPETEVVVIWFPAVAAGRSVRLRIEETYTDPGRYGLDGDELIWDRGLGRTRNAVVLPAGWFPSGSAMPATIDTTADGRVRLTFDNDRPDELQVLLRARWRGGLP